MADRRQHPSGKPNRPRRWGTETRPRLPPESPLTPGLRRTYGTTAIGFTARLTADDYSGEVREDDKR